MPYDLQDLIGDDNQTFDATETLQVQTVLSSSTLTSVPYCRRTNRQVVLDQAGAGMMPVNVVTFYIWKNDLATKPVLSARIVDANSIGYRVGDSNDTTIQTRWDVDCVKEV